MRVEWLNVPTHLGTPALVTLLNQRLKAWAGTINGLALGQVQAIRTVSSATTARTTDHTLLVDATSGAVSVMLMAPSAHRGGIVVVVKVDGSVNAVTVVGPINGASDVTLASQWDRVTVQSDGSQWVRIG